MSSRELGKSATTEGGGFEGCERNLRYQQTPKFTSRSTSDAQASSKFVNKVPRIVTGLGGSKAILAR